MDSPKIAIGVVIGLVVTLLLCLLCFLCAGALVVVGLLAEDEPSIEYQVELDPTPTPFVERPPKNFDPQPVSDETLRALEEALIPSSNLLELSSRLAGIDNIPVTMEPPAILPAVGAREKFWVSNTDTNENFEVEATLQYVTEHAYFWIENGIEYDPEELEDLALAFEQKIYPTTREFFGSEWSPGVDGDEHLYILYITGAGSSLAGYFSTVDEYHPLAHEYSNAHEMFILNADNVAFYEDFTYGVLAHEFQHMIHWYHDRNETSWMNEGFSELAVFLNGYETGGFDNSYTVQPDLQLNDWPGDGSDTEPHYGAAFLFLTYFLDRFGSDATQALVQDDDNGLASLDNVLESLALQDDLRGSQIRADDFFQDWVLANFLQDASLLDGRYVYHNYPSAPEARETESLRDCDGETYTSDVKQYGVDYIRIRCRENVTLDFSGARQVGVVPEDPHSGDYYVWSNKNDESDMTLTRSFDFTGQSGELTLTYWTWYDLEQDYDYVYLLAQVEGEDWRILSTPSGTAEDPSGNSYGWGYNGQSGGWIEERVDLSEFAGQKVQLSFEYVTDAAVHGEGLLLDDIAVPEINYSTDFETDLGGWQAEGFVRIQNLLPQTYRLTLIRYGEQTQVEFLTLDSSNSLSVPIAFDEGVDEVVLVVSGTTRYTRQPAAYRLDIQSNTP